MNPDRNLTTTSISIPVSLLERARIHAALSYRTFSQYVSYLIDNDLAKNEFDRSLGKEKQRKGDNREKSRVDV